MSKSLVRSRTMITHTIDRHSWEEIADGALVQEDGVILEIGTFAELGRRYPDIPVIGSGNAILLPGFVNSHHHVGLTPLQLGSPDMPLELWFITRLVARMPDPYLDTLYSAFEMIGSGVTTVQHINVGRGIGLAGTPSDRIAAGIRAYEDIGMRVSYAVGIRDQNQLIYQDDDAFVASLPADLRGPTSRLLEAANYPLAEKIAHFESVLGQYGGRERVRIQLAPPNLHWCSDAALEQLSDLSRRHRLPMHMHLAETAYQKEYARRRGGRSAVDYVDRFGMLGPLMTLGHAVWVDEQDIERLAESGTCICTNCSSNFRLRSGIAPLNAFEARGINTAIGIDEAGLNDDRDMLQEMRLVLRAHREPGMDEKKVPTPAQIFRMATSGGAMTTGFGDRLGTLQPGKAADLVLLDWRQISYPFLDEEVPLLDAVVQRAKTEGVRTVMCAGEVIFDAGRFTRIDRDAVLRAIHEELSRPLTSDDLERRRLSKDLLPISRAFFADYLSGERREPFYGVNARV